MSYAIPAYYEESTPVAEAPRELIFVPRSNYQFLPMIIPAIFCGISWAGNGIPTLTDIGFVCFTLLSAFYLTLEFVRFPRRFGIGGLVLWGGVLCWFCQDYFSTLR